MRNTGYFLCLRESLRLLYGETDLDGGQRGVRLRPDPRGAIQPGFYEHHLRKVANIDYCHVNSLEGEVFMKTEMPDLLAQDLSFVGFAISTAGGRRRSWRTSRWTR